MSYRPPSTPPQGAWARHLHEQRKARDLSATQAFELVYERAGWSRKSRAAYVSIDSGPNPPKEQRVIDALVAEFGWPPEPATEQAAPTLDPYEVMGRLATALSAMTEELRAARDARASLEERLADVESVLDGLVARATEAGATPLPRAASTGSGR